MKKYFFSIFVPYFLIVSCAENCKYETVRKEVSPDGKYIAVSYWKDCGAVAKGRPQVSIITLPATNLPDKGNIVIDGLGIYVDKWTAPDTLILTGPIPDYKPKYAVSKFGNINIIYRNIFSSDFYFYFSGYEKINNKILFKLSPKPKSSNFDKSQIEIPIENLKVILEKGKIKQISIINDFALKDKENLIGGIIVELEVTLKGSLYPDGLNKDDEKKLISEIQ
jgi:hypothetical protein